MPVHLTVLGHHRIRNPVAKNLRTDHLIGQIPDDLFWGPTPVSAATFTRIGGRLAEEDMTTDITFEPYQPPGMHTALLIKEMPGWGWALVMLVVHLGLSALAGLIAGRSRQAARAGARYGLLNIATVFCVHLATRDHPQLGVRRAISFTFAFSVTYLALLGLCWLGAHLAFRPGGV